MIMFPGEMVTEKIIQEMFSFSIICKVLWYNPQMYFKLKFNVRSFISYFHLAQSFVKWMWLKNTKVLFKLKPINEWQVFIRTITSSKAFWSKLDICNKFT